MYISVAFIKIDGLEFFALLNGYRRLELMRLFPHSATGHIAGENFCGFRNCVYSLRMANYVC